MKAAYKNGGPANKTPEIKVNGEKIKHGNKIISAKIVNAAPKSINKCKLAIKEIV